MGKIREDRHVTRDTFIWCNSSLERSSREYFAIQPIQLLWCWTLIANLWYLLGMEKIGKDRDRSHTPCDITASRTTSRVISRNRVSCYQDVWHRNKKSRSDVARALYMFGWGLFLSKSSVVVPSKKLLLVRVLDPSVVVCWKFLLGSHVLLQLTQLLIFSIFSRQTRSSSSGTAPD